MLSGMQRALFGSDKVLVYWYSPPTRSQGSVVISSAYFLAPSWSQKHEIRGLAVMCIVLAIWMVPEPNRGRGYLGTHPWSDEALSLTWQHYSPSVITSLDEQDTLSHFFQYRGTSTHFMNPLAPVMAGSHSAVSPASSRISSIVSTSAMRDSHGRSGAISSSTALPGCRSDIISLD